MRPSAVVAEYARCRGWLVPALADATEAEVLTKLIAGTAQLWPGEQSAMVTQLLQGSEPYIHVWIAGGDLHDLYALGPGMEAWARGQGARAARINGRPGWARVLKAKGFHRDGEELRKAL